MDIVKTIIPHNSTSSEPPIPSATEWLANMSVMHVSCLTMASIFVATTFILSFFHLFFVLKYVSNERIRNDLYALVFMFPLTTFASLIGMFIPRAAIFLYAVSLVYFMFTLFIMVTLLFNIFGGRQEMSAYLLQRDIRVNFTVPPLCFCKFIPTVESTEWFVFSQLMALLSMCIAFYGCYVMVPLGRQKHAPYRFDFLFRTCDIAQCIYTIQKFVFEFAAAVGLITSDRHLPAAAKALWWASFMCTWEMMLLSALCTYCLRPTKCKFFDAYPNNDQDVSPQVQQQSRFPSFASREPVVYEHRIAGQSLEPLEQSLSSRSSDFKLHYDSTEDNTHRLDPVEENFDSLSQTKI